MTKEKSKKIKTLIFQVGAIIILLSVFFYLELPKIAPFTMAIGSLGFIFATFSNRYEGNSLKGKRFYNLIVYAAILMAVATVLMFYKLWFWIPILIIAAILTIIGTLGIPKDKKNS